MGGWMDNEWIVDGLFWLILGMQYGGVLVIMHSLGCLPQFLAMWPWASGLIYLCLREIEKIYKQKDDFEEQMRSSI